jgi:hypothetical protein
MKMRESQLSSPFAYLASASQRRHGPGGYTDYQSYKPWLRDEFQFRCVYCLCRERWSPAGDAVFSVDHLQPQAKAPALVCIYENLLFACCGCNSAKQDVDGVLDPCAEAFAEHLKVDENGTIHELTEQGAELVKICLLSRPKLTEIRRRMLQLWRFLLANDGPDAKELWRSFFGYPEDLPCLSSLRPPGGNSKLDGVSNCHFERRQRGELPEIY